MTTIAQLEKIKAKAEELKREADRAQGRLDEIKKRMKEEFGVSSLSEAKAKLKEIITQEETLKEKFDTALAAFEAEWGSILEM